MMLCFSGDTHNTFSNTEQKKQHQPIGVSQHPSTLEVNPRIVHSHPSLFGGSDSLLFPAVSNVLWSMVITKEKGHT